MKKGTLTPIGSLLQDEPMNMQETPIRLTDSHGHKIAGILASPLSATPCAVVLCHGFLSQKNSNTNLRLTALLVESGIATFRFDWFGMGESDGQIADLSIRTCCEQLQQSMEFLRSRQYFHVGLIGSSFGGLISLFVAAQRPQLMALGLKCPVPDFSKMLRETLGDATMERWKHTDELPNITSDGYPVRLRYAFYEECLSYDAYHAAQQIKGPTLIVHGEMDEYVPDNMIQRLAGAFVGPIQVRIIPGANHHFGRPEDFRKMTTDLANWMIAHLST